MRAVHDLAHVNDGAHVVVHLAENGTEFVYGWLDFFVVRLIVLVTDSVLCVMCVLRDDSRNGVVHSNPLLG